MKARGPTHAAKAGSASWKLAATLSLVAWIGAPLCARADNISDKLLEHAPEIIRHLTERGYRNVGVMTFMFQRGSQPSTFHGGLIAQSVPERLACALALRMSSKSPELVLLRNATAVARDEIARASYRTRSDRRELFKLKYPVFWGGEGRVSPDVFLAGKVTVSADLRKTNVAIGAFTEEEIYDILEFEVSTDRSILADIGEGFHVSKGNRKFLRGFVDDAALESVEAASGRTAGGNDTSPPDDGGFAAFPVTMTIYYDGAEQQLYPNPEGTGSDSFVVAEPQEGQEITVGLRNETDETLGVVVTVNGVSTLHEQMGEASTLKKWVLDPRGNYRIKGFHQEDRETYYTIRALSEEQSLERFDDLGGEQFAGLIHLHVFQPIDSTLAAAPHFTRTIGGLARPDLENMTFRSLRDLQLKLAKNSLLVPVGTRPLFGWGVEKSEKLREEKLGDVRHTATTVVRYYQRP